jgi:protein-S-isoprenylcysteine O-methyltransferase Ste14
MGHRENQQLGSAMHIETVSEALIEWLKSTPKRTFILYPLCVIIFEWILHGPVTVEPWGALLLLWGYLQYRFVGNYRTAGGGGGPGFQKPPERIVEEGPYRFTRNPMYLGHLIFMLGLAITFQSWLALGILLVNAYWFHQRVLEDERHLEARFGSDYAAYKAEVKRWIPGVL